KWIHPIFTLDPNAMTNNDLGSIPWEDPLKLPENAVVGDLVFHPSVGGRPKEYFEPFRVVVKPDPDHTGEFKIDREPLALTDPLQPGDRIVFKKAKEDKPLGWSSKGRERLFNKVATARAKLCLWPEKTPLGGLAAIKGRELIEEQYGNLESGRYEKYILP